MYPQSYEVPAMPQTRAGAPNFTNQRNACHTRSHHPNSSREHVMGIHSSAWLEHQRWVPPNAQPRRPATSSGIPSPSWNKASAPVRRRSHSRRPSYSSRSPQGFAPHDMRSHSVAASKIKQDIASASRPSRRGASVSSATEVFNNIFNSVTGGLRRKSNQIRGPGYVAIREEYTGWGVDDTAGTRRQIPARHGTKIAGRDHDVDSDWVSDEDKDNDDEAAPILHATVLSRMKTIQLLGVEASRVVRQR